jgi:hypothetical protein
MQGEEEEVTKIAASIIVAEMQKPPLISGGFLLCLRTAKGGYDGRDCGDRFALDCVASQ